MYKLINYKQIFEQLEEDPEKEEMTDEEKELAKKSLESGELEKAEEAKSIKSFDAFVNEKKSSKWIGDIDMKKGALKKQLGVKKGEKLTSEDLEKVESKLEKKDKDKNKPGLQLGKKDAKLHKRAILAKNLMKASGAISESKKVELNKIKKALNQINEALNKISNK
jgi:hypothetical protein